MTALVATASDVRSPHDWLDAVALIDQCLFDQDQQHPFAIKWLTRAKEHLLEKLDRQFRDRPRLDTEQAALSMIRGVATELRAAAMALLEAGEHLRIAGRGYQANQARQAGLRAQQAAAELIDE